MAELTGKAISELPSASSAGSADYFALSQNGASKKITAPDILSSNKTAMSNAIFVGAVVADLNNAPLGSSGFNPSTSNIPTSSNSYGTVYTINTATWYYQIAIDTNKKMFVRQKINDAAWTAWERIVTESVLDTVETASVSSSVVPSSAYSGYVRKSHKTVTLSITSYSNQITINTNYQPTLFVIPAGFRPTNEIFAPCMYYVNGSTATVTIAHITSNGEVAFFTATNGLNIAYIRLLATYVMA